MSPRTHTPRVPPPSRQGGVQKPPQSGPQFSPLYGVLPSYGQALRDGMSAQDYGSTTNAPSSPTSQRQPYPAAPGLPVHFSTDQEQHGAVWRTVVVSAIMCLLLAGTDHRLLNGVLLESTSWLADAFLLYTKLLLSDLLWSIVIGSISAFVFPPLGFLIAVDWLIPGRIITYLALHGELATTYFFYSFLLLILVWAPPLLPLRWAMEWVLSLGSGVQHDQATT